MEKARVGDGQRRRPRLRADLDLEARRRREARGARREDEEATERVLVEGADAPPERVGHDGALGPADERERVEDSVGREAVVVRAEQHAPVRRREQLEERRRLGRELAERGDEAAPYRLERVAPAADERAADLEHDERVLVRLGDGAGAAAGVVVGRRHVAEVEAPALAVGRGARQHALQRRAERRVELLQVAQRAAVAGGSLCEIKFRGRPRR